MPIAVEQVKRRISGAGLTVKEVASALGIDESTYYRKMANEGKTFNIDQIQALTDILGLTKQEAREIFLP